MTLLTVARLIALLAPTAAPEPRGVAVSVTATTEAGWKTAGADRGELFGRLNAGAQTGSWRINARLDSATFVAAPELRDRYTLEKASVAWTGRDVEWTLGDGYVSFGRGLALSLRKVDELGVDTTLRGASAVARRGRFLARVAAGTPNITNVDQATGTSVDDPYDLAGGLELEVRLGDALTLSTYGTAVLFREPLGLAPGDAYHDRALHAGVVAASRALVLEAMVQAARAGEETTGGALYGSFTAPAGPATVLLEAKLYGDLMPLEPDLGTPAFDAVAYATPPTVERVGQLLEHPQRRVAGGRLRVDWRFAPRLLAHAGYAAFYDWLGYADPSSPAETRPGTIHDPHAGVELRWNDARSWSIAQAGWRTVFLDDGERVRSDAHAELDVTQSLGRRVSLTFHAIHEERRKVDALLGDHGVREGTLTLGLRARPFFSVAAGYDHTTDVSQPRRGYLHGDIAWDVTPSSSLRLLVGAVRGGLRCVSGVCRVFPPFEGARLTATLRF